MPRLGLDLEGTALNYAYKGIYFGYVANLSELFGITAKPAALDSLWSLSVEEQVYLIWPALIALCPKRWLVRAMLGIVAVSLGWRVAVLLTHRSILFAFAWPPACLDAFAIGTLAAVAVRVPDRARVALLTGRLLWASGLIVAAIYFWQGNFSFWIFPRNILSIGLTALATFFGAFIVWLVCDRPESLANRALSVSWLRSIGKYSYAIYLVHMLVEEWMMAIGNRYVGVDAYRTVPWQLLNGLSTFVISYILAFMSWHLIEKHFLKLKRAFPSKGAGVPVRTN
jgi:peptidoglycan/LPS O-acetylase OafA/YrhL